MTFFYFRVFFKHSEKKGWDKMITLFENGYNVKQQKVESLLLKIQNVDDQLGENERNEFLDLFFDLEGLMTTRLDEAVEATKVLKETEHTLQQFRTENLRFKQLVEKNGITKLHELNVEFVDMENENNYVPAEKQGETIAALKKLNRFIEKLEGQPKKELTSLCSELHASIKKCFEEETNLLEKLRKTEENLDDIKVENYRFAKTLGIGLGFRTIK